MADRPDDIPEDIWALAENEALKYVEWIDPPPIEGVASAEHVLAVSFSRVLLAERERCANIADDAAQGCRSHSEIAPRRSQRMASSAQAFVVERVAAAIRAPGIPS